MLAASGPQLAPHSLGSDFGKAVSYANERRDQGLLNDARRQAVLSSAQETKAKASLMEGIKSGTIAIPGVDKDTAAALVASGNDALLGHLIPQALTPEAQAQIAAGYPAIEKAKLDAKKETDLQGIEKVTSTTTVNNALEAENIITRMEKGPVPPGSTAATLAKKLSDPDGYITVSPAIVAQASATVLGKPMTEAQAAAWQTDWNRLNKLSAKFITDQRALSSQQQATGGQSRQTDFGLSFIEQQNISPTVTGNANRAILKDLIQRQLDIAKVRGWTLDNTGKADEALKKWDQQLTPVVDYSTPQAPPATSAAVPGMPGVSTEPGFMQQLIDSFSPAQPQAAAPAPVQAGAAPAAAPPVTVSPPAPATTLPPNAQSLPRNAAGIPPSPARSTSTVPRRLAS